MNLWVQAVELIKTLVWPILLVVFFWPVRKKFAGDWSRFFDALKRGKGELSLPGVSARWEALEQKTAAESPASSNLPAPATVPIAPDSRAAVGILEGALLSELSNIPESHKVPVLVRALALARLQAGHEYVYNRIFGSQIIALRRLNELGSVSRQDAARFYLEQIERTPELKDQYSFDLWSGFLITMQLVSASDAGFSITPYGRDFLLYMIEARLSDLKPL